jgi:hypothetical protein
MTLRIQVLEDLAGHEKDGRSAAEMVADLNLPSLYAVVHVTSMCRSLRERGQARNETERAEYNNAKRFRWYITDDGKAELEHLLATPVKDLQREAELKARVQREADAAAQAALIAEAQRAWAAHETLDRDGLIRGLREQGCMLDAIGQAFHLTRERVRQICQ